MPPHRGKRHPSPPLSDATMTDEEDFPEPPTTRRLGRTTSYHPHLVKHTDTRRSTAHAGRSSTRGRGVSDSLDESSEEHEDRRKRARRTKSHSRSGYNSERDAAPPADNNANKLMDALAMINNLPPEQLELVRMALNSNDSGSSSAPAPPARPASPSPPTIPSNNTSANNVPSTPVVGDVTIRSNKTLDKTFDKTFESWGVTSDKPWAAQEIEGLVAVTEDEGEVVDVSTDLLNQAEESCKEIGEAFTSLVERYGASLGSDAEGLIDSFKPLFTAFDGDKIGTQIHAWTKAQTSSQETLLSSSKDAYDKALALQNKAAEALAKIAPAQEARKRIVANAVKDFERILGVQNEQLIELRDEFAELKAESRKEMQKLPNRQGLRKVVEDFQRQFDM